MLREGPGGLGLVGLDLLDHDLLQAQATEEENDLKGKGKKT